MGSAYWDYLVSKPFPLTLPLTLRYDGPVFRDRGLHQNPLFRWHCVPRGSRQDRVVLARSSTMARGVRLYAASPLSTRLGAVLAQVEDKSLFLRGWTVPTGESYSLRPGLLQPYSFCSGLLSWTLYASPTGALLF